MPNEMTQAEFGAELYEVIALCGQAQQLLRMISAEVGKGKDPSTLSSQYGRLKERAKTLAASPGLSDEDVARLIQEYPWLIGAKADRYELVEIEPWGK